MATVTRSPQHRTPARRKDKPPAKESSPKQQADDARAPGERIPWYRTTLAFSLYSAVLMAASFPLTLAPLAWLAPSVASWLPAAWLSDSITLAPLAFIAPVFWLWLIRQPKLTGKRPYLSILAAGTLYWMLTFHYLILPHWAGVFGWLLLAMYLSVYIAGFVAVSRAAVHRMRVPLIVAAPVVWVAMEIVRANLFTGLAVAQLGHTQVHSTALIQIADAFGAYGVSFVVMLVAACLVDTLPGYGRSWRLWALPVALSVMVASYAYGYYRLNQSPPENVKTARVALLQGTVETVFATSEEENKARIAHARRQYADLAQQAHAEHEGLDLIIWPESMFAFMFPDLLDERSEAEKTLEDPNDAELDPHLLTEFHQVALDAQGFDPWNGVSPCSMLVGGHTIRFDGKTQEHYNSALLIDRSGRVTDRYYKMHLVIFGEYIPLGKWIPWLYNFSPIGPGLGAGDSPEAFVVSGMRFAPSICFEALVPHLIRRHVNTLVSEGTPPDVLVNVTNDGWFHGSSCLDQHLACNVFRAVENRRPMLVAANEGLSAHIDARGSIIASVPRLKADVLIADVKSDGRWGLYQQTGDLPAWCMAAFALLAGLIGFRSWRDSRRENAPRD